MKKIGVVTFHNSNNYGAILQTYALQKSLSKLGFTSEVIDYINPSRGINHLSKKKKFLNKIWTKYISLILIGNKRKLRTIEFNKAYIPLSSESYNPKNIKKCINNYDAFITGSDQVWNPKNSSNDGVFFLDFVPKNKIKISYAASFGISYLNDNLKQNYNRMLSKINQISIREKEGQEIIKNLIGKKVPTVLDPTFLVEPKEWEKISIKPKVNEKYVLCYHMPGFKEVNKKIEEIAYGIAKEKGMSVIHIGQKEYERLIPGKKRVFDAGPSEYLGFFKNASFVVTNSFHGTAFSLIFNKPLYVPIDTNLPKEKVLSSRISSLLNILDCPERLLSLETPLNIEDAFSMDYSKVNNKLEKEIKKSLNFLTENLK